ncbi:MAG: DUF4330 family protein [Firmicutes bacterium]|nr:DUF4330 family protein [Bacillota bacterium]
MKIVNEKGKLFGVINLVDLLVLLIIIAVIAVVGKSLLQDRVSEVVASKETIWMEVEVVGANPRYYEEIQRQNPIGSQLIAGNLYQNATIEAWWMEEFLPAAFTEDGQTVYLPDPLRENVVYLIKSEVAPDTATPQIANQEARAGRSFIVKTQTTEMSGIIRYVEIGPDYTGSIPEEAHDIHTR